MKLEDVVKQLSEEGADQTAVLKQFMKAVEDNSTTGLKTKNSELLTQLKDLKKMAAKVPEGFDPEAYETLLKEHQEKKDAKLVAEERWDELKTQLQEQHGKELKDMQTNMEQLTNALSTQLIDNTATAAIAEAGGNAKLLLPHVKQHLRMVQDDNGAYMASIVDGSGNPRHSMDKEHAGEPMSMKELIAEFQGSDVYAPAFAAPNSGGGAGNSNVNGFTGKNPFAAATRDYTQQALLKKNKPELAAQLAKQAAAQN